MQAALDSTALMLAKDLTDGTITASQITTKATAYFTALYTNVDAKSVVITPTYTTPSGSPEEFGGFIKAELAKWAKVVRDAGIRPQ